jgi:hypothetical protein
VQTIVERPAALDVHKAQVTACARVPGGRGRREQHVAEFATTVRGLLALRDWLAGHAVTQVVREATGVYWKAPWAILEDEFECVLVNARHVKQRPRRRLLHQPRPRTPNPAPRQTARTPRTPRNAYRGGRASLNEPFLSGISSSAERPDLPYVAGALVRRDRAVVHLPHTLLTLCGLPLSFEATLLGLPLALNGCRLGVLCEQFERVRDAQLHESASCNRIERCDIPATPLVSAHPDTPQSQSQSEKKRPPFPRAVS